MFVRKKRFPDGRVVFQVVENRKIDGKVRQRVLATLGADETLRAAVQTAGRRMTLLECQNASPTRIERARDKFFRLRRLQLRGQLP